MKFVTVLLLGVLLLAANPILADEAKPADAKKPEVNLHIVPSPNGWSVHAISVDAHELFSSFAAQTKLQIIVDDTVKRLITIHILDKPARELLNNIVDAYGFSCADVDGVTIISEGIPKSPSSYLLSDIASVTTKYVDPSQAVQLLPVFLQGQVKINGDGNAVVLSGPKPVLDKFRRDIEQFDIPAAQIMLDVNVVEFTDVDTDTFSAMLGYSNGKIGMTTDALTGQMTLNALTTLPTDFTARLQALVETQHARVRANPRVATLSGQASSIFIGQQQYLSTPVNMPGQGNSNYIDAGVSLSMTPLTGGEGEIILDLNEEISTLSAPDVITGLPTKTTRTARTNIRVHDGQTAVIGGLQQLETRSVEKAIPILGGLPIIGKLFRSRATEKTNVNLAVFITARLLSSTGHLPAADEKAMKARMGITGTMEQKTP